MQINGIDINKHFHASDPINSTNHCGDIVAGNCNWLRPALKVKEDAGFIEEAFFVKEAFINGELSTFIFFSNWPQW